MQAIALNPVASAVFVLLYSIAALTAVFILIKDRHKIPEKLQWMGKVLEVPLAGALAYGLYYLSQQKRK